MSYPQETRESVSFTDSSVGGIDDSLSWGVPIEQTTTSSSKHLHPTKLLNNQKNMIHFKSQITSQSQSNGLPSTSHTNNNFDSTSTSIIRSIESKLSNLPSQVLEIVLQNLESSHPHYLASQQLLPLLPLPRLLPGQSNGSFREQGDTARILAIWLGIEIDKPDHYGLTGSSTSIKVEGNYRDTFALPRTDETHARIRDDRLRKAIKNGDKLRKRQRKETKEDEKKFRELKERGRKGKKKAKKGFVKMEVDEDSMRDVDTSNTNSHDPPTPWLLAVEARRHQARASTRNSPHELKSLMESLQLLDSSLASEEWSYLLLHPTSNADPNGAGRLTGSWGGQNASSGRLSPADLDSMRRRERERNGVHSNDNDGTSSGLNGAQDQVNSGNRLISRERRSARSVSGLMRESWNQEPRTSSLLR